MEKRIILTHGVYTKEGNHNIGRLQPGIEDASGLGVIRNEYGFMGFLQTYWRNREQARQLAALSADGDWWVTHSNGAAIAWLAVREYRARPCGIINFNPALGRKMSFEGVPYVLTIHSADDTAVSFSRFLPLHPWGDQGRVGYKGNYAYHTNLNATNDVHPTYAYRTHTGAFTDSRYRWWSEFVGERVRPK